MTASSDLAVLKALASLGTATIGEVASNEVSVLDQEIVPLHPGQAVAGVALTVRCLPGDNLALHHALARVGAGDMLVVDYGQSLVTGPFGEIMALAAQTRGAAGMVIDGAVRDSAQIGVLGFPVWCRGLAIPGTAKEDLGVLGQGCEVGGVAVAQGDIVVADADAIIVFAPDALDAILEEGRKRVAKEERVMERIRAGESTLHIFGLGR